LCKVTDLKSCASFLPFALRAPKISVINAINLSTFLHIIPPSPLATTNVPPIHMLPFPRVHLAEDRCLVRIADEQGRWLITGRGRGGEARWAEIRRVAANVWGRLRRAYWSMAKK
jgi:hypothetical protein